MKDNLKFKEKFGIASTHFGGLLGAGTASGVACAWQKGGRRIETAAAGGAGWSGIELRMNEEETMETIIFATKNKGKIKEINEILADMDVNVISMEEAGITIDVVEDGKTFEENAMKKAVQVMEIGGKITLSDDSGLEIDYMDKAPGIYSARFMGEDTPYPERFKAIFEKLNGVPEEKRTARFVSCIAAAFPDGRRLVSYDTVEGIIGYEAKGENGFGYDPIFYVPEKGKYMAELSSEEKNAISHRGKALRKMKEMLKKEL